jgi:chemotaxis protein CheX
MLDTMIKNLVRATHEVFETMVFLPVAERTPIAGDALRPKSNVVAIVGFAGQVSGLVAFYGTKDAANTITGNMLGIPPASVNGEMPDAIGELANMIAGSFRSKMVESGIACAISIPTVTTGSDFYTRYVTDVQRVLCPFQMETNEVFVELIVTK